MSRKFRDEQMVITKPIVKMQSNCFILVSVQWYNNIIRERGTVQKIQKMNKEGWGKG